MLALIQPFWRPEPFDDIERELIDAMFIAHHKSCFRDNASSYVVLTTASASGQIDKAIAAGMLTIGGFHGPLRESAHFLSLDDPAHKVSEALSNNLKIPGWGSSFFKGEPDPLWTGVDKMLELHPVGSKIYDVTARLHQLGKNLYPNPSAYTAAVGLTIGLPIVMTPYLFIAARLSAWTQLAGKVVLDQTSNKPNNDHQRTDRERT